MSGVEDVLRQPWTASRETMTPRIYVVVSCQGQLLRLTEEGEEKAQLISELLTELVREHTWAVFCSTNPWAIETIRPFLKRNEIGRVPEHGWLNAHQNAITPVRTGVAKMLQRAEQERIQILILVTHPESVGRLMQVLEYPSIPIKDLFVPGSVWELTRGDRDYFRLDYGPEVSGDDE